MREIFSKGTQNNIYNACMQSVNSDIGHTQNNIYNVCSQSILTSAIIDRMDFCSPCVESFYFHFWGKGVTWDVIKWLAYTLNAYCFRNLKSTRNKNNKFLKYKTSICLDHTYMYIVLRVPYTCKFIAIDSIM